MRKTACFTVAGGKCISVNGTDLAISGEVLQLETIAGPWPWPGGSCQGPLSFGKRVVLK